MDTLKQIVDIFLHLDKHLTTVIAQFGVLTYIFLFIIIFMETGLVVTPFLPGDSLIFVAGTLAAFGSLNIVVLFITLALAAIIGDSVNYWIGSMLGRRVFHEKSRFFKKEYLVKTEKFYEKYGGKTIILARFMPIIRTFAPFVAGIGKMNYSWFLSFNIIGGIAWVSLFLFGGYFFGNIPIIKNNFEISIFVIIFISILPGITEYIKHKRAHKKADLEEAILPP
jgi:membrane-associated protein